MDSRPGSTDRSAAEADGIHDLGEQRCAHGATRRPARARRHTWPSCVETRRARVRLRLIHRRQCASCFFKYSSNFSLAFFNPQTGSAECVSQCGCVPSRTMSRPGKAAPARMPSTVEASPLPQFGILFDQSFAFVSPAVAASVARVAFTPWPAILAAEPT
jgi:hypothetical protein